MDAAAKAITSAAADSIAAALASMRAAATLLRVAGYTSEAHAFDQARAALLAEFDCTQHDHAEAIETGIGRALYG